MNEKSRKPSDNTDIRRTWAKFWPDSAKDEVWARISRQIDRGDTLPPAPMIVAHKSPEKMQ